jgi:hypothetical protein
MECVTLRPHHLVRGIERIQYAQKIRREMEMRGEQARPITVPYEDGYGAEFHERECRTLQSIMQSPDVSILITDTWDDFCAVCNKRSSCPHDRETESDIRKVTSLGYRIGQQTTSGDLLDRMRRKQEMMQCVIDEICTGSDLGKWLQSVLHTLF